MQPFSITDLFAGSGIYVVFMLACLGLLIWSMWSGREK